MTDRKKALLVVSFGTTHKETRENTIEAIENHLAARFPDRILYRGWTSRMIVRIMRNKYGESIDTVEDALNRMKNHGVEDVLVQPTYIMEGAESDRTKELLKGRAGDFSKVSLGKPLLSSNRDLEELAEALGQRATEEMVEGSALIYMGHGSAEKKEANDIYRRVEEMFHRKGYGNIFVATVEGEPSLEQAIGRLGGGTKGKKIYLAPLMIAAGDHARKDMAGEDDSSWKNRLASEGFVPEPVIRGLGEYEEIREMLARHALEADTVRI